MAEEQLDVEYISLHGYTEYRNTPADTEVSTRQKIIPVF